MATVPTTAKRARKPAAKAPAKPARPKLTHAQLLKLAAKNPPPQRWYDEDFSGLTKPKRS